MLQRERTACLTGSWAAAGPPPLNLPPSPSPPQPQEFQYDHENLTLFQETPEKDPMGEHPFLVEDFSYELLRQCQLNNVHEASDNGGCNWVGFEQEFAEHSVLLDLFGLELPHQVELGQDQVLQDGIHGVHCEVHGEDYFEVHSEANPEPTSY